MPSQYPDTNGTSAPTAHNGSRASSASSSQECVDGQLVGSDVFPKRESTTPPAGANTLSDATRHPHAGPSRATHSPEGGKTHAPGSDTADALADHIASTSPAGATAAHVHGASRQPTQATASFATARMLPTVGAGAAVEYEHQHGYLHLEDFLLAAAQYPSQTTRLRNLLAEDVANAKKARARPNTDPIPSNLARACNVEAMGIQLYGNVLEEGCCSNCQKDYGIWTECRVWKDPVFSEIWACANCTLNAQASRCSLRTGVRFRGGRLHYGALPTAPAANGDPVVGSGALFQQSPAGTQKRRGQQVEEGEEARKTKRNRQERTSLHSALTTQMYASSPARLHPAFAAQVALAGSAPASSVPEAPGAEAEAQAAKTRPSVSIPLPRGMNRKAVTDMAAFHLLISRELTLLSSGMDETETT